MGVARSIEERLEGLVEGFFTKVFRSGLQPVEVGRRILREMDAGRTVSVNRVYAPNEYQVVMGSDDYGRFEQMEAGLKREFSDLVIEQAKLNRWHLMGLPRISFNEEEGLGKGEFRVEASLAADEDVGRPVATTREPQDEADSSTRAVAFGTAERLGLVTAGAELVVLEEGKPSDRITITKSPVVIGRMSTSDVVIPDPNVSRRHAELKRTEKEWWLTDLGSTNGSQVNGKTVREQALADGDRLTLGSTQLLFKLREA